MAPGGILTFKVEVKNPGTEPIILTELIDDIYGDLNGKGTCGTGGSLPPAAATSASSPPSSPERPDRRRPTS